MEGFVPRPGRRAQVRAEQALDLGALYDSFAGPLYRYLITLLGNADEAEDALQEIFLGILRRPQRQPIEGLRPYLFRAAHNQAMTVLRRHRRQEEMSLGASWIDAASCAPGDRELAMDTDGALQQLSPEQREVVVLKLGEDLTFREMAEALGIPQNTAASRYRLALAHLRTLLGGNEDDA
jgi:RNA polymerase sigma-70 factor (ECF subfamily)